MATNTEEQVRSGYVEMFGGLEHGGNGRGRNSQMKMEERMLGNTWRESWLDQNWSNVSVWRFPEMQNHQWKQMGQSLLGFFFKVFIEFVTILVLFIMIWFFGFQACGILTPRLEVKPVPPALGGKVNRCAAKEVLTTTVLC